MGKVCVPKCSGKTLGYLKQFKRARNGLDPSDLLFAESIVVDDRFCKEVVCPKKSNLFAVESSEVALYMLKSQQQPPAPQDYEEYMTWRIRWYLVIAITIAYTLSIIGFWVTRDTHYLLFITPTALIPFVRYLVPMDKKRYELKLAKINANKDLSEAKLQIQMLRAELGKQQDSGSRPPTVKT